MSWPYGQGASQEFREIGEACYPKRIQSLRAIGVGRFALSAASVSGGVVHNANACGGSARARNRMGGGMSHDT